MSRFAISESLFIQELAQKISYEQDYMLMQQVGELVSRGILVVERGDLILTQSPDGKFSSHQFIRLSVRDMEYIRKLEEENKSLKEKLNGVKNLLNGVLNDD
jgi:hypothetical protein